MVLEAVCGIALKKYRRILSLRVQLMISTDIKGKHNNRGSDKNEETQTKINSHIQFFSILCSTLGRMDEKRGYLQH